jgi:phosphoribosyl-AMP cyclohydrolase
MDADERGWEADLDVEQKMIEVEKAASSSSAFISVHQRFPSPSRPSPAVSSVAFRPNSCLISPMNTLEDGNALTLDFSKIAKIAAKCPDVIPVAVQHADTHEVILVAYTNELAMRKTLESRSLVLWSTSRNELWEKGKTSGETFDLVAAFVNCEQNSLLYTVRPRRGGICHTKNQRGEPRNCYYRRLNPDTAQLENVDP